MIGIRARGFHHLIRVAKEHKLVDVIFKYDINHIENAVAIYVDSSIVKNPYFSNKADYLIILNRVFNNVRINPAHFSNTEYYGLLEEQISKTGNGHAYVVSIDKHNFIDESIRFSEMVILPNNFNELYGKFIEANKKMMPNATRYTDVNSAVLKYLFAITEGSKNFFFWAVNAYFKHGVQMTTLEKIMQWNKTYGDKAKSLRKGSITAYTGQRDIFALIRETSFIRNEKRANDVINMFNTAQKKALKSITLTPRDRENLSKFGKLSAKKKLNFIKKMSTIDNADEILKQMAFLSDVHFEWKKESFIEYLKNNENIDCEIVLDKGDIVLLKVKNYETVKRLTKATNWCISKDKKYWNEYVEFKPDATQYIIFDFSKKEDDDHSIIGFTTVYNRGITNAHDFENHDMMKGGRKHIPVGINDLLSKFENSGGIYSVLERDGIDLSLVVAYEPSKYKWNRESAFKIIEECIDAEDYYVLSDFGTQVAIMTENDDIKYFLGENYVDGRGDIGVSGDAHIVFMDFEKTQNDPNRIIFGVINYDMRSKESSCNALYNARFEKVSETFDNMIERYGLPYDIICRSNSVCDRFISALTNFDIKTIDKLMGEGDVKKMIGEQTNIHNFIYCLQNSIFTYHTFDFFDLFVNKYKYHIEDVISVEYASSILVAAWHSMIDVSRGDVSRLIVPSNDDLLNFYNGKCRDARYARYIFYYLSVMRLLDGIKNPNVYGNLLSRIHEFGKQCDLFDLIISRMCSNADIFDSNKSGILHMIISYAKNSDRVFNALMNASKKASRLSGELSHILKHRRVETTEMWVKSEDGNFSIVNKAVEETIPAK